MVEKQSSVPRGMPSSPRRREAAAIEHLDVDED
jgi:hypothetical protein